MHTSGLVVTLDDNRAAAEASLAALRDAGPFQLGEQVGRRLAVALEAVDGHSARAWHDWALALPGIAGIEVVFAYWEEADAEVSHVVA